jgi:hypothetical protein
MKEATRIISVIMFVFSSTFLYSQINSNIFENIFENISLSPYHYIESGFIIREDIPKAGDYSARLGVDLVVTVMDSKIKITYWRIGGEFRIQFVIISAQTDLHTLGKYIGETTENILKYLNAPFIVNEHEISYISDDWQYHANFKISNKLITEITFGLNL